MYDFSKKIELLIDFLKISFKMTLVVITVDEVFVFELRSPFNISSALGTLIDVAGTVKLFLGAAS
jgi:hypothetical protein